MEVHSLISRPDPVVHGPDHQNEKPRSTFRPGVIAGVLFTLVVVAAGGMATWLGGFFALAVALNSFVGQTRAVNASMYTYMISAAVSGAFAALLGALTIIFLAGRRKWNAAGVTTVSSIFFMIGAGISHGICLVAAIVVANSMRTTP
ncbi:MAG TPA: hypothetical protein PKD24_10540 [Pyrinomonadaceae bacterium]|nr:hypothetical protein [Pyrinomonadaceae bacterium]HMP65364.1 hypothetical protein [Pyrinomonadaceae bacterium]